MNTTRKGFWARLFSRDERSEQLTRSAPTAPSFPVSTPTVTADNALGISAVYRSVFILSHTAAQLPLSVWRGGTEVSRTPALINRPNLDTTRASFVEETVNSLALTGNAYWRLYRASETDPVMNIEVLNPHNMFIEVNEETGRNVYRYSTKDGQKVFPHWQVKHLSLMRVPGSPYGLGPIQAAQAELTGMVDVRDYAGKWFREGNVPTGILKTDNELTPDMADAYKARWNETMGGTRDVAVLGNGIDYHPVFLAPEDAQFLQVRQFDVTSIARLFGIPASKLLAEVNGNSMTYQNLEQANTDFIRDTLSAYLNEIEEALSDLIVRGQTVRFKLDALLRADKQTRYATYATGIGSGFITINEARADEGLAPLEETPNANGNT